MGLIKEIINFLKDNKDAFTPVIGLIGIIVGAFITSFFQHRNLNNQTIRENKDFLIKMYSEWMESYFELQKRIYDCYEFFKTIIIIKELQPNTPREKLNNAFDCHQMMITKTIFVEPDEDIKQSLRDIQEKVKCYFTRLTKINLDNLIKMNETSGESFYKELINEYSIVWDAFTEFNRKNSSRFKMRIK